MILVRLLVSSIITIAEMRTQATSESPRQKRSCTEYLRREGQEMELKTDKLDAKRWISSLTFLLGSCWNFRARTGSNKILLSLGLKGRTSPQSENE